MFGNRKHMSKIMLHKKNSNLTAGNHFLLPEHRKIEQKYKHVLKVNHYKWFGNVYYKMDQIIKDDITNPTGKESHLDHLDKFGKVDLAEVGYEE